MLLYILLNYNNNESPRLTFAFCQPPYNPLLRRSIAFLHIHFNKFFVYLLTFINSAPPSLIFPRFAPVFRCHCGESGGRVFVRACVCALRGPSITRANRCAVAPSVARPVAPSIQCAILQTTGVGDRKSVGRVGVQLSPLQEKADSSVVRYPITYKGARWTVGQADSNAGKIITRRAKKLLTI